MVYVYENNDLYTLSEVTFEHLSGARRNSQLIENISCVKGMVVIPPDLHEAWKVPNLFRRSCMHYLNGDVHKYPAAVKKCSNH